MKNLKSWCQEKKEKGKEWFKRNKFELGIVVGGTAFMAGVLITEKIFEPKIAMVQTGRNKNIEGRNFLMRIAAVDRFGIEHPSPWARFEFGDEDKERVIKAIDAALDNLPEVCEF